MTPSSLTDFIESKTGGSSSNTSRSRPLEQESNPWQKRPSKSMDRLGSMKEGQVIQLPAKDLFFRYSSKSISDHVGTQPSGVPDVIK